MRVKKKEIQKSLAQCARHGKATGLRKIPILSMGLGVI